MVNGEHLVAMLGRQCHVAIQPRGSEDSPLVWPLWGSFGRSLDVSCRGVVFLEGKPDDCSNYDFDEDEGGRTAPSVYGHGYIPLSQSGTCRYENWINKKRISYCSHHFAPVTNVREALCFTPVRLSAVALKNVCINNSSYSFLALKLCTNVSGILKMCTSFFEEKNKYF